MFDMFTILNISGFFFYTLSIGLKEISKMTRKVKNKGKEV